jgi:hypothetical protein
MHEFITINNDQKENALVLDIDHPLRVGITEITLVRRSVVDFVLVEGILHFIGEDACREARNQLLGLVGVRCMQDVVVYKDVLSKECKLDEVQISQI